MPLPARSRIWLIGLGALALVFGLEFGLQEVIADSSLRQLLMFTACNVVVAVSLNVINGMAGQFSIGHAGFVGIGAYTSAVVASHIHAHLHTTDVTFAHSFLVVPASLFAAAVVAGVFGFLLGLPSLRLKGDYLAIVTLGFAEIFRLVIATAQIGAEETPAQAWMKLGKEGIVGPFFHAISVTITSLGGQNGYAGPDNQGVPLYAGPFWIVGLMLLLCVVAWRIKFSGWGRALRALREDEIAAAAVGVDPTRYKVTSFVIAAIGGGLAGGMMALMRDGTPIVQPDTYGFQASFDAITMVILGGSGSVTGAAIGGIFVTLSIKAIEFVQASSVIQDLRQTVPSLDLNALRMIVYAAVLITLMIVRPEGLLGERELLQRKRKKAADPPSGGQPKTEQHQTELVTE